MEYCGPPMGEGLGLLMTDQGFNYISGTLEDCRKLVATAKVQRWEVLKWAVVLNVAVAGAASVPNVKLSAGAVALVSALVVSVGLTLIVHFNYRAAGARRYGFRLEKMLGPPIVPDFILRANAEAEAKGLFWYDWQELWTFSAILVGSAVVSFLAHPEGCEAALRIWQHVVATMSMTAVGLCLNILGVVIAFFWGFPQPSLVKGAGIGLMSNDNIPDEGRTVAERDAWAEETRERYTRISGFGLWLMFAGFLLQLFDTFR
jgi:hypothetical protein